MTTGSGADGGPVRPVLALALGVIAYAALAIFGLGMTSLIVGRDVIDVPGLGQIPGVVGMLVSITAVAASIWAVVRPSQPSYVGAVGGVLAAYLGYLLGLLVGAVTGGVDVAAATAAVGTIAVSWFGAALAAAGGAAAWGAIALVRTRAERPRWPWEADEDE